MRSFLLVMLLVAHAVSAPVRGEEVDVSGSVALEARLFGDEPAWAGQDDAALQGSVAALLEWRWRHADDRQRAALVPYLRWDAQDDERSLADLREAYWAFAGDGFDILVGANTVFWGVTESVHLVDVVNQTDFAGDIDGEDKLGQPMLNVAFQRDWGEVSLFVMPWFRERTFTGRAGRFRAPVPVDTDRARYTSGQGADHIDVALRYSHYIGDVDIGLSAFSGTAREPRLVPGDDGESLVPVYDLVDQFGIDVQYTREAWLWKLEAIARNGVSHSFAAAVAGFEYTVYQVGGSAADASLLLEYQYDGRNALEPATFADNDVFVGTRLALNDVQDTAILAGVTYDTVTGEAFINVEAERRLGENWFAELRVRAASGAKPGDTSYWLQQDDYVQLQIARYY